MSRNKTVRQAFTRLAIPALLAVGLSPAVAQETVDVEKLFKEGIFQREQGNVFTSIEALETVLSNQPSLHRARLELAVAYFRAMNYEQAQQQAQRVLDDPKTPENVRLAVLAFMAQIK
ncbi:MAG: tetratricopeptide repeat protein, partial [Gammaproteobacteria bacterium]|nr:tetratricopeptide repeat protein [Gammaproteobacteria bacterium]